MISLIALGLIAGLLAVDQRAGWQGLFAQPVFAGALVGVVLGEIGTCVSVGLALELVYLSVVPMRGARVSDQVAAGVVGAGVAGLLARSGAAPDPGLAPLLGVLFGLIAGEIGGQVTKSLFALHNRFLSSVEFSPELERGRMVRQLTLLHVASLGFIFVVESLFVVTLGAAGLFAGARIVRLADAGFIHGAVSWGRILPAVGVASIVHLFWHHRFRNVLLACAALGVIVLWLL